VERGGCLQSVDCLLHNQCVDRGVYLGVYRDAVYFPFALAAFSAVYIPGVSCFLCAYPIDKTT